MLERQQIQILGPRAGSQPSVIHRFGQVPIASGMLEQKIGFPQPGVVGAAAARHRALERAPDGVGVGPEGHASNDFRIDGEEVADDAFFVFGICGAAVGEHHVSHDCAYPVVNARARFKPGVEGEKHGIVRELLYALS